MGIDSALPAVFYVKCTNPKSTAKLTTVSITCELLPKLLEIASKTSGHAKQKMQKLEQNQVYRPICMAEQQWIQIIPTMVPIAR